MSERIALVLEYDGAAFFGWQRQAGQISVQQTLEEALQKIIGHEVRVTAAGRTDTGVHALMQVVHFDSPVNRPLSAWTRGVNTHLPNQITVRYAQAVPNHFHARFDAYERQYRYILVSSQCAPALLHGKIGWTHYPLNVDLIKQAMTLLEGEHDFSCFRASECQAKSPIKTIKHAKVTQKDNVFYFDFTANAFLHHMIRNIVGALIYIGCERLSIDGLTELLLSKDRKKAPPTFMADGLYLTKVAYPEHYQLELPPMPTWFWGASLF